jgi:hypothetical protein
MRPEAAHGRVIAELEHATAANPRMRRHLLAAQQPDQRSATVHRAPRQWHFPCLRASLFLFKWRVV